MGKAIGKWWWSLWKTGDLQRSKMIKISNAWNCAFWSATHPFFIVFCTRQAEMRISTVLVNSAAKLVQPHLNSHCALRASEKLNDVPIIYPVRSLSHLWKSMEKLMNTRIIQDQWPCQFSNNPCDTLDTYITYILITTTFYPWVFTEDSYWFSLLHWSNSALKLASRSASSCSCPQVPDSWDLCGIHRQRVTI